MTPRHRRLAAAALIAPAMLPAGCGNTAAADSRLAGHDYGVVLHHDLGQRLPPARLRALCRHAIVDGRLRDPHSHRPGKQVDYVVAQFVAGCQEAVNGRTRPPRP